MRGTDTPNANSAVQLMAETEPNYFPETPEQFAALIVVLAGHMTPLEATSALEEWECVCAARGWDKRPFARPSP